jgi:heptosyltransferase-2
VKTLSYDHQGKERSFLELLKIVRAEHFDVAFVGYPRLRIALMLWLAGVPQRVGTGYRWYSFLLNRKVFEHRKEGIKSEAAYSLGLLVPFGITPQEKLSVRIVPSSRDRHAAQQARLEYGLKDGERLVILHPGSSGSAQTWPASRFAALAAQLRQHLIRVIISGSEGERELVDQVAGDSRTDVIKVVGRFSLMEYAAFIEAASAFVANSTGPLHVAAAVGTPVVGLYPSGHATGPVRWGPITDRRRIVLPPDDQCLCAHDVKCDDPRCMERIEVDVVLKAIEDLLEETPIRPA